VIKDCVEVSIPILSGILRNSLLIIGINSRYSLLEIREVKV
jgi:hypothetical protein